MNTETPRTDKEQKWSFGDNRESFDCVTVEFAKQLESELIKQANDSAKMLGMATDLNLLLQNKADMWRDEFQRIRSIVFNEDIHTASEIDGICERAMLDIRSNISLIDQREKAGDEICRLREYIERAQRLLGIALEEPTHSSDPL